VRSLTWVARSVSRTSESVWHGALPDPGMVPIVTLGDAAPILLGMAAIFSATAALAAVDSRLLRRISREQEILDRLPETCGEPGGRSQNRYATKSTG
jgi:hypothetical protein